MTQLARARNITAMTDANGELLLPSMPAGLYDVCVEACR
jgi:hypothetical protein